MQSLSPVGRSKKSPILKPSVSSANPVFSRTSPLPSTTTIRHATIDSIIWPEKLLTQDIFRIISVPDALDVEFLVGGKAKLFEYRIKETSSIIDKPIMACEFPADMLIAGITREDKLFIPNGRTTIRLHDKVFFIGTGPALDTLAADFFQQSSEVKSVSIIGGGSVGFMLADMLECRGIRVLIPNGDTLLSPGDQLKIFTMKEDSETIKELFFS